MPTSHGGEDWYAAWRALPADRQNPFRTYTVRAARPERREVDVDSSCTATGAPPRRGPVAHAHGQAFLELPTAEDVLPLEAPAGVEVRWLTRASRGGVDDAADDGTPVVSHGARLVQALTAELTVGPSRPSGADPEQVDVDAEILWETPADDNRGWDRRQVAFMGYWRLGRAEA